MLIPFRTDRPRLRPTTMTWALIAVNVLVHAASWFVTPIGVPVRFRGQVFLVEVSRLNYEHGLWGSHPTLPAFFTHMFLHGDVFHLAGNMLFLWLFGSLIEDVIRPWGLAALYLGGGIVAALAHIAVSQALGENLHVPMVGASGAVAAIMGLFLLRFFKTRIQVFYWFWFLRGTFWVQSIWALLYWVIWEIVQGIMTARAGGGAVAHWAHVGGFAAGAVAAPFLGSLHAARKEYVTDDPAKNVEQVRRTDEAAAAERALRADPTNAYQMRRLAQAYRHAGEHEAAVRTYQQCVTRFATRNLMEQAAEVYLELLEYHPPATLAPEVQLKLAQHLETAHPLQAAALYRSFLERLPRHPEAERALLRLATLYSQGLHQPSEAARTLDQFLQRFPDSRWAPQARQVRADLERQIRPG